MLKRFRIVGLCLVAVFAVSAVAASAASALVWEISKCEKVTAGTGKYNNSVCTEPGGTKEWEILWKPVAANVAVVSEGTLRLSSGGVTVECSGENEGTVGTAGKDQITKITKIVCVTIGGTCEEPRAKPVNLPWNTQLVNVGGKLRDELTSSGAGPPGWLVECKVFGIFKVNVTCTAPKATTAVTNNTANDTVETTFDAESEEAKCEGGTSNKGTVRGTLVIAAAGGEWLRAVL